MINCEKLLQFLKDEIPLTMLEQLRTDPCIICNQNVINEIAVRGLDIWDMAKPSNQNTHQYPRVTLYAYTSHASTQHKQQQAARQAQRPYGLSWQGWNHGVSVCNRFERFHACMNTLTPRKKLAKKKPPINQRKRQQEERKTAMAPSDASEETELGRKSYSTFSEWSSRMKRSFLK
jgi:hypothetical protein